MAAQARRAIVEARPEGVKKGKAGGRGGFGSGAMLAPVSEGAVRTYDPAELRARMAVCFTAAELRDLADALGVTGVRPDRAATDAARVIVRHFERDDRLGALVD